MKKVGVLGTGQVGQTLALGFLKHGYEVMIGSRDPKKISNWQNTEGAGIQSGTYEETAQFGDLLVLAVAGSGAEETIRQAGLQNLKGKTILDVTNPISKEPPENGVLKYFTGANESLMERLQQLAPDANFVKAFNCVGSAFMVNPQFPGGPPTMFICGNNESSKQQARQILDQFGWETADMGGVQSARGIEPLAILWCIPGFLSNQWSHAFKLLRLA